MIYNRSRDNAKKEFAKARRVVINEDSDIFRYIKSY